ncbi:tigger transposable element-derived protein 1-like [Polypterus senegalus]|uniref:tigger transposable element-derived protein 1-like n=1 Tax=Polypterus senegalus TaxID=55291 RepID=UPI0019652C90|nr:tigger transposable element-derived protein 1-like [Polypterus senegalus]
MLYKTLLLAEVRRTNLSGVWKKLCPLFVDDFHGFEESVEAVTEKDVAMGKQLNLEVEAEDVTELLASHGEELSAEDLIQLEKQLIEEEDTETPEPKRFTTKGLAEGFSMVEDGLAKCQAEEPSNDRFNMAYRAVIIALQCYRQILEEKQSLTFHTSLEQFFTKVGRPATDPVPSTLAASRDETPLVQVESSPASSTCSLGNPDSPDSVSPAPSAGSSASPASSSQ